MDILEHESCMGQNSQTCFDTIVVGLTIAVSLKKIVYCSNVCPSNRCCSPTNFDAINHCVTKTEVILSNLLRATMHWPYYCHSLFFVSPCSFSSV